MKAMRMPNVQEAVAKAIAEQTYENEYYGALDVDEACVVGWHFDASKAAKKPIMQQDEIVAICSLVNSLRDRLSDLLGEDNPLYHFTKEAVQ